MGDLERGLVMISVIITFIAVIALGVLFPGERDAIAGFGALAIVLVAIYRFIRRISDPCPKCRKWSAMNEVSRTFKFDTYATKKVEKQGYNSYTGRQETYYENVEARRDYYDVVKVCRFCGYKQYTVDSEVK